MADGEGRGRFGRFFSRGRRGDDESPPEEQPFQPNEAESADEALDAELEAEMVSEGGSDEPGLPDPEPPTTILPRRPNVGAEPGTTGKRPFAPGEAESADEQLDTEREADMVSEGGPDEPGLSDPEPPASTIPPHVRATVEEIPPSASTPVSAEAALDTELEEQMVSEGGPDQPDTEATLPRQTALPASTPASTQRASALPTPPIPAGASALATSEAVFETPYASYSTSYAEEPGEARTIRRPVPRLTAHLAVLTVLATSVVLAFVLIEPSPRWLLLVGAAAAVLGLEGTLRQTWREPFASGAETAPYLFVPALYMLSVPLLIEHNIRGELVVLVALLAGAGFGLLAWSETASVRALSPEFPFARVTVTAATYLAAFSVFSMSYVFGLDLPAAILAVGLASTMLAVEVLREGEIDPMETLGFAAVTGIIMAEARWLMYYMPLDTYLAGLVLVLVFFLVTGLLHSYITRALSFPVSLEYGAITSVGVGLVVAARAAGLA